MKFSKYFNFIFIYIFIIHYFSIRYHKIIIQEIKLQFEIWTKYCFSVTIFIYFWISSEMLSITHIRWHEQFFTFWLLQFEMLKILINVTWILDFYTILQTSDEISKNSLVFNLIYFHQISHQGNITGFRYVKVKSITRTLQFY